jgi:hypothetical protein
MPDDVTGQEPGVDAVSGTDLPSTEPDPFESGADRFERSYVEKLRNEAADYRTKYAPYRDLYGDLDEDIREYVLDLNRSLLSPDKSRFVEEVKGLLAAIEGTAGDAPEPAAPSAGDDDLDRPLTRRELQQLKEQEAQAERERAEMQRIHDELGALGYVPADKDEYGDTAAVIAMAVNRYAGDLSKAHAARAERFQKAVDEAVAARLEAIRSGAEPYPPQSTATGSSPAGEPDAVPEGDDIFAWARKRANSRPR